VFPKGIFAQVERTVMIEINIHIPTHIERTTIPSLIEQVCDSEQIILAGRTTLSSYPGSIHWHYKQKKERGTLEITWWEQKDRLWFKVAAGRNAAWIESAMARIKAHIEQA
jgi:hypothetical protein